MGKVQPTQRLNGITLRIQMRQTSGGFLPHQLTDAEVRDSAKRIQRLVRSILIENDAHPEVDILEDVDMICPKCGLEWEIDEEDGLPACCDIAQSSWREGHND